MTALCACPIPAELGNYKISSYTAGYGQCFAFLFIFFSSFFILLADVRGHSVIAAFQSGFFLMQTAALWCTDLQTGPMLPVQLYLSNLLVSKLRANTLCALPHSALFRDVNRSRKGTVSICGCNSLLLCVLVLSRCRTSPETEFPHFPLCPSSLKYNYVVALKAGTLAQTLQRI